MNDFIFAFRQLLKNPGFTVVAVLTLALGIGVNTSMFSALQALLARPLPYPEGGRLVQVFQTSPHSHVNLITRCRTSSITRPRILTSNHGGAERQAVQPGRTGQPAEGVRGLQVSADLFPLLGIQPALGRWFTTDEDRTGRNNVVILDQGFWLRRFAGDTNIIGRVLRLDGESVTVVGVMPARFHDIMLMGPAYLWRPIAFTDDQRNDREIIS